MTDSLSYWLNFLLPSVPYWLVWLVGIILALVTWRKHPPVSLLALLACSLILATSFGGTIAQAWVYEARMTRGWGMTEQGFILSAITLVRIVFGTIGYVLLLIALFGWRGQHSPERRPFHDIDLTRRPHEPGHPGIQPPDHLP